MTWHWQVLFEPRDLWVGLFIKAPQDLYLCFLPMFPLHVWRA